MKIGVAAHPAHRLALLQTANPYPLRLLGTVPGGGQRLERELHERHASDRLQGEWFRPTPAVLATVAEARS